ncbi:S-ribosylhomocysteine lyase [Clostridium cellulovorans]|uniref:S-ribosylhomocysteine lyase n=1 Tax=Clostridium cellulovorans (strain ATCC 35296 / DSM 3052 / OCM 3 / 743B) TaxID=573061 RepID=D9SL03_CLOC7|nr:S-ribosylhomocysteine lyase [Clostridium cellulovorans]ADL53575.1 quorum-sensing autoinducer 2 (AI-2), LuxS [Clostridium cellulovorans 743B]
MDKIESFLLDHTKVKAPFVRKCEVKTGPKGDNITKFDLRFTQPNESALPTGAIHTLEHLLAGYMREKMDGIIDLSPMGCRTGFYMVAWGDIQAETVIDALTYGLKKVLDTEVIPATTAVECGNYRDHSLFAAKEYAKLVLEKGISSDIYRQ